MRSKFPKGARVGLLMLDRACWSQWDVRSMPELGTPRERAGGTCRAPLLGGLSLGIFYDNEAVGYGGSSFCP